MHDETAEFCESVFIHDEAVALVRENLHNDALIANIADIFKVLGDFTRTKIICALEISEMCVCDIASLLGMSSSAISHQLRTLKQARLVKSRREGKIIYYSLADEHIKELFETAIEHSNEE